MMSSLRDSSEARDQGCRYGEHADFGGELTGGRNTEGEEMANALKVDVDRSVQEISVMAVVIPEKIGEEKSGEIGTRDGGGDAGAGDAEGRKAEFTVNEDPVAREIDEICGDRKDSCS